MHPHFIHGSNPNALGVLLVVGLLIFLFNAHQMRKMKKGEFVPIKISFKRFIFWGILFFILLALVFLILP